MDTPLLDYISKTADFQGIVRGLAENPRRGSMVLGGLTGGALGLVDKDVGVTKGLILGTGAGWAANKWFKMDPEKFWTAIGKLKGAGAAP